MVVLNWFNGLTLLVIVLVVALGTLWFVFKPGWMGFAGKTLWDWFALMSFPILLAIVSFQLNQGQLAVERSRAQEEAVQSYIDRISNLVVLSDDLTSDEALMRVAEARTEVTLNLVSGERAARILRFLTSLNLLKPMNLDLRGLDLSDAELKGIDLSGKSMESSRLVRSDLEDSELSGVDFEDANLRYADFKNANLQFVDFEGAELKGADFDHADLRGADLSEAEGLSERLIVDSCMDATTRLPKDLAGPDLPAIGCIGTADD